VSKRIFEASYPIIIHFLKLLYLKKHKITSINNKLTIIVDEKPIEVGVDPYNKLIDSQSDDNRKKI
jgi:ABC-2 type transport system permease protein